MRRRRAARVTAYASTFLLVTVLAWRLFPDQHPLVWLLAGLAFFVGWHMTDVFRHTAALLRRWRQQRK